MKDDFVYQLKISLTDVKPPVWRRILIPAKALFWDLHIAIQDSFGWGDGHLHQFFVGRVWDRESTEIFLPGLVEDDGIKNGLDESKIRLFEVFSEKTTKINYIYDFGDNWEHKIELEKVLPFDANEAYPKVLDGKRMCPWEDSGGPWGYMDKVKILKGKKDDEYWEIAEWLDLEEGEKIDYESFEPNDVIFRNPATELKRVQREIEQENS